MSHRSRIHPLSALLWLSLTACGGAVEDDDAAARDVTAEGGSAQPKLDTTASELRGKPADPLVTTWLVPPRPVLATDEQRHLLYELLIDNPDTSSIVLTRLEVFEPGRHQPLATFSQEQLVEVLVSGEAEPLEVGADGVAIAFLDVALAPRRRLPRRLEHRWQGQREGRTVNIPGPGVPVDHSRALRISPPLRGDNLANLNGCCTSGHRRALFALEGGLFLAQRFAVDLLRVDALTSFNGDPSLNESYFIYGAEVLAVGAGEVVAARDGIGENVPTEPLPPFDIDTAAGNYVVQALADGHFALYAHLQPGSLTVQPGEHVEPGRVLGLVGNTGNSTEPHLHFHVTDGPSPLASSGLPFVFDHFALQATIELTEEGPVVMPVPPPSVRADRLPLDLDIIAFP